jgi:P4 family phage/plasmid primase-like protien
MNDKETLKTVARNYWSLGFNIVPFKIAEKRPLVEWQKWENQRQSEEEFQALPWDQADGFGVVCGRPNDQGLSLAVVDFDIKKTTPMAQETGCKVLSLFRVSAREKTPSGGEHLIFFSRKPAKTISAYHNTAALELLGENKLCVMYPSEGYSKLNDNLPSTVEDLEAEFLAVLKRVGVIKLQQGRRERRLRPCFDKLLEKEALSHDERVALVIELEHAGYPAQEIKNVFHEHQAWHTPDYNQEKTDKQIDSIFGKYKQNNRETLKKKEVCFPECPLQSFPDCRRTKGAECYFDEDVKFVPKLLAEELMEEHSFITMRDNEQIYVYSEGFYQPYAEPLIKQECKARLEEEYRINRVHEVVDFIKASTFQNRREEAPNLVPLKNGVLDLDTMELKAHSSEYMFFNLLPVEYDPNATCPKILKFLGEITVAKEDVDLLLEVQGYCLYRDYVIAKSLMLAGEGANGKSTFLALVKAFLGLENVSGRSLQDLEEHRFAKADLHYKLANIYSDLPDKALYRTGTFKMLTGRDLITAEKKFMNSFNFVNYAKLLFSCNKVPEAYDDTSAFFRRWIIMVFPNKFEGDNCDPYILSKLTTPEELSGLLNLALASLKKLLEKGTFSYSKTTEELKEDYIRKSSPIAAFIMDCIEVDSDAAIEKKVLFKVFAAYCRQKSLPIVTETTFLKNLSQHIAVIDFRPEIGKERPRMFKGIRYSEGASSVSRVSRHFLTLSSRREEFEKDPWKIMELPEDPSYIKVGIRVDTLDALDAKQQLLPTTTPIAEVYQTLRNNLNKASFSQHEALDLIVQQRNCDLEEAEKIFQIFVDKGLLFKDSYGLWRWNK